MKIQTKGVHMKVSQIRSCVWMQRRWTNLAPGSSRWKRSNYVAENIIQYPPISACALEAPLKQVSLLSYLYVHAVTPLHAYLLEGLARRKTASRRRLLPTIKRLFSAWADDSGNISALFWASSRRKSKQLEMFRWTFNSTDTMFTS